MPNWQDNQFCLEIVTKCGRPDNLKHCEGLYDTKCFKSQSTCKWAFQIEPPIWEIRTLPLHPEDVQCTP